MNYKKNNGVYAPYYYKAREEQKRQEIKNLFNKYQKPLVKGLNHWALGTPFRKLLGIDKECKDKIFKLTDNSYHTRLGKRKFQATYRTYSIFAERIGITLSKWDIVKSYISGDIKLYQNLNEYKGLLAELGLLDYREFPAVMLASGDPIYSSAGDGHIMLENANWNTCHDAATGSAVSGAGTQMDVWNEISSGGYRIQRMFMPHDTSDLGSTAIVSAATESLWLDQGANHVSGRVLSLVGPTTQASNTELITADYNQCGDITNPDKVADDYDIYGESNGQYLDWPLTSLAVIETEAYTKLGLRYGKDCSRAGTADETNRAYFATSKYAGTDKDPKLVLTYTAPIASQAVWF